MLLPAIATLVMGNAQMEDYIAKIYIVGAMS